MCLSDFDLLTICYAYASLQQHGDEWQQVHCMWSDIFNDAYLLTYRTFGDT